MSIHTTAGNPFGLLETVRIRDKAVEGGSRLVNREDLTDCDLIIDDEQDTPPAALPVATSAKAKGKQA